MKLTGKVPSAARLQTLISLSGCFPSDNPHRNLSSQQRYSYESNHSHISNYEKAERTREESLRQHKMIYLAVKEHRHEDVYKLLSLHFSLPVH